MLRSNMKNEQQTTFHKKVTSKRRSKNQAFFTHTRLFSMVSTFFCWNFFAFLSKVLHLVYKSACLDTIFDFFKDIFFEVSIVLFGNLEAKKGINGKQ